jgi:sterol 3beta-glucosyltransferase
MNIGIFAWGSRGDVQPFVALSIELKTNGHDVKFFAPENFKSFVESHKIEYYPLYGNTDDVLYSPEGQKVLQSGNAISLLRLMQKEGKKIQPLLNKDLLEGCEKVDYIITSVLCHVWISCIAEKMNKKWGLVTFSPPTTPTKKFPFAGLAFINTPIYNKLSHQFVQFMYWAINKKDINNFRKSIALQPLKSNIINRLTMNNILNLYAISPTVIPRPDDWQSNSDITGYLFMPSDRANNDGNIPTALSNFLQEGEPPIYIGMGSMPIPNPDQFKNIISEILNTTDYRVVFCKGWSVISDLPAHDNLFTIEYVNHDWLLPKCKVAIIHGGAGTIASCLKAKTPMIIASVFGDQPWWGKIMQNKSLGVHVPVKKLTTKKIKEFIEIIQSDNFKKNVIEIGDKINDENGLTNAVSKINKYFETV